MKKPRSPKAPAIAQDVFSCPNCEGNPEFRSVPDFKAHLTDVHKITEFKGKKSLTMHLDCADSYTSAYEWELAGLKFHQCSIRPRAKNDMMRFGD